MNFICSFSSYLFTHNFIFFFIVLISIFTFLVLFISFFGLSYISFISHGVMLEFFWTFFPLLIVLLLLIPLVFDYKLRMEIENNVFCISNQWYWESEEAFNTGIFLPALLNDSFSEALVFTFLTGTGVCFNLTSNDVIHSFGLNSLFIKIDCVPGVIHSLYINLFYSGCYIVNCTELCGVNHSVMPLYILVN
uniref:Cytochrome c oxidase subunit 2 n=1 Tax=Tjalfiella sp. TaxID=3119615 RepID=A0AAU6MWX0_9METZ